MVSQIQELLNVRWLSLRRRQGRGKQRVADKEACRREGRGSTCGDTRLAFHGDKAGRRALCHGAGDKGGGAIYGVLLKGVAHGFGLGERLLDKAGAGDEELAVRRAHCERFVYD